MKLTFVGGTGRCGTSITRKLLGCSDDVAVLPFEHRILIDPDGPIEFLEGLDRYRDPYRADLALQRMFNHLCALDSPSLLKSMADNTIRRHAFLRKRFNLSRYSGWKLSDTFTNYRVAVKNFRAELKLLSYNARWAGSPSYSLDNRMYYFSKDEKEIFISALRKFYSSLISDLLRSEDRTHFVEDSTWNISYIESLRLVFPQANFVHVYRDPRDVVASFLKQRWMPNELDKVVRIYQGLINDILEKAARHNCYRLKFENLVERQDAELSRLCAYLGIDSCEKMKSFRLQGGNIGRYLKEFNRDQIEYLNDKLAPQIEVLGYAK